jgi:hypothetical protein
LGGADVLSAARSRSDEQPSSNDQNSHEADGDPPNNLACSVQSFLPSGDALLLAYGARGLSLSYVCLFALALLTPFVGDAGLITHLLVPFLLAVILPHLPARLAPLRWVSKGKDDENKLTTHSTTKPKPYNLINAQRDVAVNQVAEVIERDGYQIKIRHNPFWNASVITNCFYHRRCQKNYAEDFSRGD